MRRLPLIGDPVYLESRGFAKAVRSLAAAWRLAWTPRIPPDPVAWAEGGGVIMPAAVAAQGRGGRLSFSARPYWRLLLRWFAGSPGYEGVQHIHVVVASQCGKTTAAIAMALYGAEWLPGPGLFFEPTDDQAEELVRDRLRPIFQASPFGRGLKPNDLRLGGCSFQGGGNLNVLGVGSPNALKARPARWVFFDEYDEAVHRNRALGSPFERADTRTRVYGSLRRVVGMSTPTVEDDGIWPYYEESRRYEWHAKCPHCGAFQRLELANIRWPRNADGSASASPRQIKAGSLAWYECAHCEARWTDAEKRRAVSDGREHCIDPDRPMIDVGLHIPAWYSPDVTLSDVAAQFLESIADPEKYKQFRNEWMAEPRSEIVRSGSTDQAHLAAKCVNGYEQPAPDWWRSETAPEAPDWVREVTWGFDVQGAEAWAIALGWGDYGEKLILWSGRFAGDNDLEDAAAAFRRPWNLRSGLRQPKRGMMDSGYRTHEVYRVCAKTPGLYPSKGRVDGEVPMRTTQVDRLGPNRRTVGRVDLWILWTTYWQDQVAAGLETDPGRGRGATHLPANPPADLYRHLTAERKKMVKSKTGTVRYQWVAHDPNNHLRDCLVYATAAAGHAKCLDLPPARVAPVAHDPEPGEAPQATREAPPKPAAAPLSPLARLAALRKGDGVVKMNRLNIT